MGGSMKEKYEELLKLAKASMLDNRNDEESWYEFDMLRKIYPVSDSRFIEAANPSTLIELMETLLKYREALENISHQETFFINQDERRSFKICGDIARQALSESGAGGV